MEHYQCSVKASRPAFPICRFLLPKAQEPLLEAMLRRRKMKMRQYLGHLIRLARREPRKLPTKSRFTTRYQRPRLNLQKVNFRPHGRDWGEFKTIARGCGVSMCRLFVHLLLMDSKSDDSTNAVASKWWVGLREIVPTPAKFLIRTWWIRQKPPD
ncbi:MAG: DUF1564 family protein [Leptospiraceae bacterium]|nr:DUF1564 family protein [Leptospiraceae bacterium]